MEYGADPVKNYPNEGMGGMKAELMAAYTSYRNMGQPTIDEFEAFNRGVGKPYDISVSYGFYQFDIRENHSMHYMLAEAEKRMYAHKQKYKMAKKMKEQINKD